MSKVPNWERIAESAVTVRPSTPQGYQYEVAYTWDNPVPYPAFFRARNCIVSRVSAKTAKVKNNFINGKTKLKRILSCLFGVRRKVQVTNLPSRTLSLLSVLLRTRSAQRLSSQHFAAVPTPNIAELVPSLFFCPQAWFLRRSEHSFPEKTSAFSRR